MFNVNCSLADLREDHDKDVLEVKSYNYYKQKTDFEQVYIRITPGENPSKAVEILVNADDLRQAINHAVENEPWVKLRNRRTYRYNPMVNEEDSIRV